MKRIRSSRTERLLSWALAASTLGTLLIDTGTPVGVQAPQAEGGPAGNVLLVVVVPFASSECSYPVEGACFSCVSHQLVL